MTTWSNTPEGTWVQIARTSDVGDWRVDVTSNRGPLTRNEAVQLADAISTAVDECDRRNRSEGRR